jgi:DNA-binding response OmpR family regulator
MEASLLIVEDETRLLTSLSEYFEREGFQVTCAENGAQALEQFALVRPALVILDVQLPLVDGLEVCRQLRRTAGQAVAIIMISGIKKELVDRVVGLELGADVYLTKPFETRELLAQVRALLRRVQAQQAQGVNAGWFVVDDNLRIHFARRLVTISGHPVQLTRLEFDLLEYLARRPGVPCGRSDLVDAVWGYETGGDITDAAVNTAVSKLRSKIEPDPAKPHYIQSVHGIGYRFQDAPE